MFDFNNYYNNEYKYIYILSGIFILILVYILYKFFTNIDNKNDDNSIKKYVNNLKKEQLRFPTTFGSGRDYIITKYYNLLTSKQCDALINIAKKKGLENSLVFENGGKGFRTDDGNMITTTSNTEQRISKQAWLRIDDDIINNNEKFLINRLQLLSQYITGINIDYQEEQQVVMYEKGGFFKPHFDSCEGTPNDCFGMNGHGGQRITTLLIYLNDNFKGGETKFTNENVNTVIKPVKGMAILFYNVSEIDLHTIHPFSKHTGTELIEGTKWVCNIWSHESSVKPPILSKEEIANQKRMDEILNAVDDKCRCPNCPNPNCEAKKEKKLKCRMKKCPNEKCPNYYLKHMACQCPNCGNPYCKSKVLKECLNPNCKNRNCPNAVKIFADKKKNVIDNMPK